MENKKQKILVLGGSGYIGSHLVENYLEGYSVYFTGTKKVDLPTYIRIDFNDEKSFLNLKGNTFDLVIFFSSLVSDLDSVRIESISVNTNVYGVSRFLQFLIDGKFAKKMIYISSMTVYHLRNISPVTEDAKTLPSSTYGLTKLLAENIFEFACERNGVKGITLRLPGIYGGNRKSGYIYSLIEKCVNNKNIYLETEKLDYWEAMHIDDVCVSIGTFINNYLWKNNYNVFNISYGEEVDFIKTAHLIKEYVNSTNLIVHKGDIGYVKFYLSNDKFKKIVDLEMDYKTSLLTYVKNEMKLK